ncbi:MAG: hypothetical protein RhofKO_19570 [Rhodothermales bacterium]
MNWDFNKWRLPVQVTRVARIAGFTAYQAYRLWRLMRVHDVGVLEALLILQDEVQWHHRAKTYDMENGDREHARWHEP